MSGLTSNIIGTSTLTYTLSNKTYTDTADVVLSYSNYGPGIILTISSTFSDDKQFPSIPQDYRLGKLPGIYASIVSNRNTGSLTGCKVTFKSDIGVNISNVSMTVVINTTTPTFIFGSYNIAIPIPLGTYTFSNMKSISSSNFKDSKTASGIVHEYSFYGKKPFVFNTQNGIFSPENISKAIITTTNQTNDLLKNIDPKGQILSHPKQIRIANESGIIVGYVLSIVGRGNNILDTISKK